MSIHNITHAWQYLLDVYNMSGGLSNITLMWIDSLLIFPCWRNYACKRGSFHKLRPDQLRNFEVVLQMGFFLTWHAKGLFCKVLKHDTNTWKYTCSLKMMKFPSILAEKIARKVDISQRLYYRCHTYVGWHLQQLINSVTTGAPTLTSKIIWR